MKANMGFPRKYRRAKVLFPPIWSFGHFQAFRKASSIYEHLAVYCFFERPPF